MSIHRGFSQAGCISNKAFSAGNLNFAKRLEYMDAAKGCRILASLASTSSPVFSFLASDRVDNLLKLVLLESQRGSSKSRCIVSPCVFTSCVAARLKNFAIADLAPLPSSSALLMHLSNAFSMIPMSDPWPLFVRYLVRYSTTPYLDVTA